MVREFQQNDLDACAKLFRETYNDKPWENHWNEVSAKRYLGEFTVNPLFVGYVALKDDQICGALFAHRRTWWTKDEIYVDELYIEPGAQRKGFGKMLLDKAEQYAKENGLAGVTLLTNKDMPAKNFYVKNGYTVAEHVVFLYKEV